MLLNITGGSDLTLQEVQAAADFVSKLVDPDANIIFGMVTDPKMEDEVRVTVIATGLTLDDTLDRSLEEVLDMGQAEPDELLYQSTEPKLEIPNFWRKFGFGRRANGEE